ncbi:hypothetical protein UFOVP679_65 [uncultured Caudovirales phage]|uniref:Uncharacterized protein n=1 Tax=uncultured Caudovirales phage TaxID=2100421 RepID=A0A6J5NKL2_9CAUD|nr:hypothetical protein UFOVP679_65 [uncultured Caudovirales phage]
MSIFSGMARQAAALPPVQPPAAPPRRRGLFGGRGPSVNPAEVLGFLIGGPRYVGNMRQGQRDDAERAAGQVEAAAARQVEDRLRAQLSPADGPMGSGTGAPPSIEQQMAAINEARLLNPTVADQFAPVVQQRRMADLMRGRPIEEQLAVELNPERSGYSYATQFEDMMGAEGSNRTRGAATINANPKTVTVNDDIFSVTGGQANRIATAQPGYDDVTGRINANTVSVAPAGQVYRDGQLYVESTAQRPMSDSDQAAVAKADSNLMRVNTAVNRAAQIKQQISQGQLNLGPMTNVISAGRNMIGQSDQNSLNYDAMLAWAREARNAVLQANTGVQTDQDAVRELETILSGTRDERVVQAAIDRYIEASNATAQVLQRDIERRSGGQVGQPQAQGGQMDRSALEAEARRRGLIR